MEFMVCESCDEEWGEGEGREGEGEETRLGGRGGNRRQWRII